MTNTKPRVHFRICRRDFVIGGIVCGLSLYGLAHTRFAHELAWRQARGTWLEPHVIRWTLSHTTNERRSVERALARNEIHEGQSVDEVIAKHGPFTMTKLDRYTTLDDFMEEPGFRFEGFKIIAKDGRLRTAVWWTCVGHIIFFDSLTPAEQAEFCALRDAERERKRQSRLDSQIAVSSGAFYEDVYNMPQPDPKRDARIAVAGVGAYSEPYTQVEEE